MLQKFKNSFYRFMSGRYGADQLNITLLVTSLIISIVGGIIFERSLIVTGIVYVLSIIVLYRAFSKKIYVRQKENMKFMNLTRPLRTKYNIIKLNLTQRESKHIQCPNCKKILRVPRGKGKIEITCPQCHTAFEKRS